jgi:hypothetical protein
VIDTIGGRVVQIIGSQLQDMTVTGSFGQDHTTAQGESWRQAEAFLQLMTKIMNQQSADATSQAAMQTPPVFSYPPRGWRFQVYVKDFSDAGMPGTSIRMSPGIFNQRWMLTLFIVQDASTTLVKAGESSGVVNQQAAAAIAAYMARISDGFGWSYSQYVSVSPQGISQSSPQPAAAPSPSASTGAVATGTGRNIIPG